MKKNTQKDPVIIDNIEQKFEDYPYQFKYADGHLSERFKSVKPYRNGYAIVQKNGRWGCDPYYIMSLDESKTGPFEEIIELGNGQYMAKLFKETYHGPSNTKYVLVEVEGDSLVISGKEADNKSVINENAATDELSTNL